MHRYLMLFLIFPMSDKSFSFQIPCMVNPAEGVKYQKITWYKVLIGSGSLVGLVRKDLQSNTTQQYKFANHSYQIGADFSLLHVPEHNQENCEIYRCCLWPPVGHKILQSDYSLPQDCQSNVFEKTEFASSLQVTSKVLSNQNLIIAGVLLAVLNVAMVVLLLKVRRKGTKIISE